MRSTINSSFSDSQIEQIRHVCPYEVRLKDGLALGKLDGDTFWLVYMAVHPKNQNVGVGTSLLKHVEALAKALGAKKVMLKAKDSVSSFYLNRGYSWEEKLLEENECTSNYYSKMMC